MSPEEIAASEDVSELYAQLQAARAFSDEPRVRLLQRRMRELAGHDTRSDARGGKSVAATAEDVARLRSSSEGWGGVS